jgi:hypothetical protein
MTTDRVYGLGDLDPQSLEPGVAYRCTPEEAERVSRERQAAWEARQEEALAAERERDPERAAGLLARLDAALPDPDLHPALPDPDLHPVVAEMLARQRLALEHAGHAHAAALLQAAREVAERHGHGSEDLHPKGGESHSEAAARLEPRLRGLLGEVAR